jgi:hypothetical protein
VAFKVDELVVYHLEDNDLLRLGRVVNIRRIDIGLSALRVILDVTPLGSVDRPIPCYDPQKIDTVLESYCTAYGDPYGLFTP